MAELCHLPGCDELAARQCSSCKRAKWCSEGHQREDWRSGRHPRLCATAQVGLLLGRPDLEALFIMHQSLGMLPTPEWLDQTYVLEYLGRGTSGIVFKATPRGGAEGVYAIKLVIDDLIDFEIEAHVSMLLSQLYVDVALTPNVMTPIVKAYDYGWAPWSRADAIKFLQTHLPSESKLSGEMESSDQIMVSALVMELAGRDSLFSIAQLDNPLVVPHDQYEEILLDVLLQVLLTVHSLNNVVRFNHKDLSLTNVFITLLSIDLVIHVTASSDTTYNIKTRRLAQIADFGHAQLQYDGPGGRGLVYHTDTGYTLQNDDPEAYAPWADMQNLGLSLLGAMPLSRINALAGDRPLWRVLSTMILMDVNPVLHGSAELAQVRLALARVRAGHVPMHAVDYNALMAAVQVARLVVFWPSTTVFPSATRVLRENHDAFRSALDYTPTRERIVDFTLHVGHTSTALLAAWHALASASKRRSEDPSGSPPTGTPSRRFQGGRRVRIRPAPVPETPK